MFKHYLLLSSLLVPLACAATTEPTSTCTREIVTLESGSDTLVAVQWISTTRDLVAKYRTDPSARPYALVAIAEFTASGDLRGTGESACPSARAAIGQAAATVLRSLYPAESTLIADRLSRQRTVSAQIALTPANVSAGEAIGRVAAEAVLARASGDGSDAIWTGTVPTTMGAWRNAGPPTTPMLGQMKPWVLTAGDQLRPGAPPAFGSPAFLQALAEVRSIVLGRTPEQLAGAKSWALSGGTHRTQGYWNQFTSELAARSNWNEAETAHTFALLNIAMNDASIACFDAKYAYWMLRPSQADPTINLAVSLPNHPSYPSSHSCTSGAAAEVLSALVPTEALRVRSLADEIGVSRLYAGIHYRFDVDTGLALGQRVARLVQARDAAGGLAKLVR